MIYPFDPVSPWNHAVFSVAGVLVDEPTLLSVDGKDRRHVFSSLQLHVEGRPYSTLVPLVAYGEVAERIQSASRGIHSRAAGQIRADGNKIVFVVNEFLQNF